MAKAQRRGDKEATKPKKVKDLVAAPAPFARSVLATAAASPKIKKS